MQSVSDDDVRKRLLEKPRFELAAKVVFKNINTDMQIAIQIYVATSSIQFALLLLSSAPTRLWVLTESSNSLLVLQFIHNEQQP